MSRLWPEGEPVAVSVQSGGGQPVYFTWRGHGYRLAQMHQRWQVDVDAHLTLLAETQRGAVHPYLRRRLGDLDLRPVALSLTQPQTAAELPALPPWSRLPGSMS